MNTATLGEPVQSYETWAAFVDALVGDDGGLRIEVSDAPNFRTADDVREFAAALVRAAGYVDSQA